MKNYIIITLVVLVLAAAGFFGFKMLGNKTSSNTVSDSTPTPIAEMKITLEEIANHKDATSCWMVVEGNVYDVTSFIPNHPGGEQILLGCGKDATEMFNTRPNDGTSHSNRARQMLDGLQIGVLSK